jgi:hypothetical protein
VPKKLKPYKQRLSELTLSKNCGSREELPEEEPAEEDSSVLGDV